MFIDSKKTHHLCVQMFVSPLHVPGIELSSLGINFHGKEVMEGSSKLTPVSADH